MATKLHVGVIGVGHLGALHAEMYSNIQSALLVGVMDSNKARAYEIAKKYKTHPFHSIEELLENVQAVSIATPTSTHYEIAEKAIRQGVHMLIEKPITSTSSEAVKLIELSEKNKVKIQVGHIERFNPALLALKEYNLKPVFIESHRLSQFNPRGTDVAVILDLMIHDIDIVNYLVRSPWKNIQANGVAIVSNSIDIANARIQFENGCIANLTASRISHKKMRKMRLFQQDAYISIDFLGGTSDVFRIVDQNDNTAQPTKMLGEISQGEIQRKITYEKPPVSRINALKYELELFVDSILNGKVIAVTAQEALVALEIAQKIITEINQQQTPEI